MLLKLLALISSLAVAHAQASVNNSCSYDLTAAATYIDISPGNYTVSLSGGVGGASLLNGGSEFPGGTGVSISLPIVIKNPTRWFIVGGNGGNNSLGNGSYTLGGSGAGGGGASFAFDQAGRLLYAAAGGGGAGAELPGQDGMADSSQPNTTCHGQGGIGGHTGTMATGESETPVAVAGPGAGGAGVSSPGEDGEGPDAGSGGRSRHGHFAGGIGFDNVDGGIGGGGGAGVSGGGGGGGYCGGNGGNSGDGDNNSGQGGTSIVSKTGLALLDPSKHVGPVFSAGQDGNTGIGSFYIAGSDIDFANPCSLGN